MDNELALAYWQAYCGDVPTSSSLPNHMYNIILATIGIASAIAAWVIGFGIGYVLFF